MNDNTKRKVALFVCHDLLGLVILNSIVPAMKAMGLEPMIINTTNKRNRKFRVPTPGLVSACNVRMLEDVIIPFLEDTNETTLDCLTYRQLCRKYALTYMEVQDVNDPAFVDTLEKDAQITGGISIRFLQIFEPRIIEVFNKKGFMWNLHSGILGKYKGLLLPYRAIENGEKEYGLTLHEIAPGIDEGGIVQIGALPLDSSKPVMDLYLDTAETAINMVVNGLQALFMNPSIDVMPQPKAQNAKTYYPNPTASEFLRFMEKGVFYIDPTRTLQRIVDFFIPRSLPDNQDLSGALQTFLNANGYGSAMVTEKDRTTATG